MVGLLWVRCLLGDYHIFMRQLMTILLTYKHKTHVVDNVGNVISNADVNYLLKGTIVEKLNEEVAKDGQHLRHLNGICEDCT
ncbi:uncharacterized protein LOC123884677 isoform X1 [Trifolium pratense]|uniref:uncharacterized protein LOC123884677 isoform X1 n=1 Tax=Trifolium pratense TaxID=57577 RepID=UPI001E691BFD|nr:uncharacterized protein LOC123884677 isoform X1 [Trifolium pratense]XP_045789789.1 uncharacterized protein LOC123884677 isoform X1 [Trifolium pratense]